jgi:hypothetical protein
MIFRQAITSLFKDPLAYEAVLLTAGTARQASPSNGCFIFASGF